MRVRKSVVGVIYQDLDEPLFLVMHRIWVWKGWEFPKGGIERSDLTPEDAVRREIKEETGLTRIRVMERLPYTIKYPLPKGGKFDSTEASVFLIKSFENEIKIPGQGVKEHDDHKWLPYKEARKTLKFTTQKKALDIAWKHMGRK